MSFSLSQSLALPSASPPRFRCCKRGWAETLGFHESILKHASCSFTAIPGPQCVAHEVAMYMVIGSAPKHGCVCGEREAQITSPCRWLGKTVIYN